MTKKSNSVFAGSPFTFTRMTSTGPSGVIVTARGRSAGSSWPPRHHHVEGERGRSLLLPVPMLVLLVLLVVIVVRRGDTLQSAEDEATRRQQHELARQLELTARPLLHH